MAMLPTRRCTSREARLRPARTVLAALLCMLAITFGTPVPLLAQTSEVSSFETPEAAAEAMVEAIGADSFDPLLSLLSAQFKEQLLGGDEAAAKVNMARVHAAAKDYHGLRAEGDDRRIMLIGPEVWPLPFPIVRIDGRWRFDAAAGIEEMVNRRIGRNELSAVDVARAYVAAQREYASADRDDDEVLEYATRIASREDRRDGLYWPVDEDAGETPSPFGPLVADARAYLQGHEVGDPFKGYYFKVLTRQGLNPPGGRYDYVINGNMIGGFALVAFPADHGNSGIMTFVVSHHGNVMQKDLGEDTDLIAGGMEEYNPDETWEPVID